MIPNLATHHKYQFLQSKDLWRYKIWRKFQFQGVWTEFRCEFFFSDNPSQNALRLIYEIELCGTLMKSSIADFDQFSRARDKTPSQNSLKSFRVFLGNPFIRFVTVSHVLKGNYVKRSLKVFSEWLYLYFFSSFSFF